MRLKRADFGDLSSEVFARRGFLRFRAGGHSMRPLIRDGDILTIEPVQPDSLRVGDVAFYRPSKDLVIVHRVVARCEEGGGLVYLIRGDASTGPCERVPAECVLGRAVLLERNGRKVRLDRGLPRLIGLLWVKLSPWGNVAYAWWTRLMRLPRRALRRLVQTAYPSPARGRGARGEGQMHPPSSPSQPPDLGAQSPRPPLSHSVGEGSGGEGKTNPPSSPSLLPPAGEGGLHPLSHSVGEGPGGEGKTNPPSSPTPPAERRGDVHGAHPSPACGRGARGEGLGSASE